MAAMRMCRCMAVLAAVGVSVGHDHGAARGLALKPLDGVMHPSAPHQGVAHSHGHGPSPHTPAVRGPASDVGDGVVGSTASGEMLELAVLRRDKVWGVVSDSRPTCVGQGHDEYVLSMTASGVEGGGDDGRQGKGCDIVMPRVSDSPTAAAALGSVSSRPPRRCPSSLPSPPSPTPFLPPPRLGSPGPANAIRSGHDLRSPRPSRGRWRARRRGGRGVC